MALITVVGPLKTRKEAEDTAQYLGSKQHSVYSRAIKDNEGYDTDESEYYVEKDDSILPETFFGYTWNQIQKKQHKT